MYILTIIKWFWVWLWWSIAGFSCQHLGYSLLSFSHWISHRINSINVTLNTYLILTQNSNNTHNIILKYDKKYVLNFGDFVGACCRKHGKSKKKWSLIKSSGMHVKVRPLTPEQYGMYCWHLVCTDILQTLHFTPREIGAADINKETSNSTLEPALHEVYACVF